MPIIPVQTAIRPPVLKIQIMRVDFPGIGSHNPIARAAMRLLKFCGLLPLVEIRVSLATPCGCELAHIQTESVLLHSHLLLATTNSATPRQTLSCFSRN